jgi:hypothetical protein
MAISPVASAEGRGVAAGLRRELGNWNFCFGWTGGPRRIATLCCCERSIVHITANQLSSDRLSEADRLSRTRFCLSLGF